MRVLVRGGGLAGLAAAKLLHDRGAEVCLAAPAQEAGRILAVSVETLELIADLFDMDIASLQIGPMVGAREVDWSSGGTGRVAQAALVCDARDLTCVLARKLENDRVMAGRFDDGQADWIVEASGRHAGGGIFGGERVGYFARIADWPVQDATTITTTDQGWIFTAPHPKGGLSVLMIAPSMQHVAATPDGCANWLARAGLTVRPETISEIGRVQPIAPFLATSLTRGCKIKAGDAALALDPLRGDGTGFALRGGLLAQAVIGAIGAAADRACYIAHYEARMRSAFVSHLNGCRAFYRAARHAEIWARDIAVMDRLARELAVDEDAFGFRLEGRDLVAMPQAVR